MPQEVAPVVLRLRLLIAARLLDRKLSYVLDHPVEVLLAYGMNVRVRCGVEKVDRVRNSVLDCKLYGIDVVPKRPA